MSDVTARDSADAPGLRAVDYRDENAQQRAIDLIGEHFCRTGRWPSVEELQRDLERAGDTFDLRTALEWMDVNLGGMATYPVGTLTIAGLARYPGANADLDTFIQAVGLAYGRYTSDTADPRIRRADFERRPLRLGSLALRKLYVLLESSMVVFNGGSGGADDAWERIVANTVKDYRNVDSINAFLAVRARLIPERRSPRAAAQEAETALSREQSLSVDARRRREGLRNAWAKRAGTAAYVVTLVLVVPVAVFFLVNEALGATVPSGVIAVGTSVVLGVADHVLGLSVRDAAGGLRGIVARRVDRLLRRIQYPGSEGEPDPR
jgi:hypothetical protein